jgi:hypothetical protein
VRFAFFVSLNALTGVQDKVWHSPPVVIDIPPVLVCCVLFRHSMAFDLQEGGEDSIVRHLHGLNNSTGAKPA